MKRELNPALWLVIGLPAIAVAAGLATLAIALAKPEHELPKEYHWEGAQLERDFARAARAAALGVRAELDASGAAGICRLALTSQVAPPAGIEVRLIHATRPELDRRIELRRTAAKDGEAAEYVAPCRPLPDGHWRFELIPAGAEWSVRGEAQGRLERLSIAAGAPGP